MHAVIIDNLFNYSFLINKKKRKEKYLLEEKDSLWTFLKYTYLLWQKKVNNWHGGKKIVANLGRVKHKPMFEWQCFSSTIKDEAWEPTYDSLITMTWFFAII